MSGTPEDDNNFIVDCDILEKAKENIQPLAGGRSATALAAVLKTPHAHKDARLATTKARLRERVKEALEEIERIRSTADEAVSSAEEENEDELTLEEAEEVLLSAYVQLVTWTVEHYPRGQSAESGILELLEEATRTMRHSPFAKADPRYLNLWLRYASYVDRPEVIFEFLLANEIGTAWAKLYEEYALVLERLTRRSKADEIYMLGINRKAEPLDHLQRRHKDFQKRMMVAAPAPAPESDNASPASSTASAPTSVVPRRKILGDSTSFTTSSSLSSTPGSQRSGIASASSHDDVFSSHPASSSSTSSAARPNARMPIFVDPSGTRAEAGARSAWPELGTRKERVKENTRTVEKMEGTVLKQRGAAKAATKQAGAKARAAPKIVPFRDPEPAAASSSKIVPFRDPDPTATSGPASTKSKASFKSTSKTAFVPFKDGAAGEQNEPAETQAPAPPAMKFVPFKDPSPDQSPTSTTSALPVPDSVMRPKALASDGASGTISEAEALRKDPFKNYKDV